MRTSLNKAERWALTAKKIEQEQSYRKTNLTKFLVNFLAQLRDNALNGNPLDAVQFVDVEFRFRVSRLAGDSNFTGHRQFRRGKHLGDARTLLYQLTRLCNGDGQKREKSRYRQEEAC